MSRVRFVGGAGARLRAGWKTNVGDYVTALTWSPDGDRVAVATGQGPIHVLDAVTGTRCARLDGHEVGTLDLAWCPSPSSLWLASAGQDGMLRIWDAREGRLRSELAGGTAWVERLAWSRDGSRVAAAAGRALLVVEPAGGPPRTHASPVTIYDIAWRPSGGRIAASGYGGVRIWKEGDAEPARSLPWKGASLRLAWSPTGTYIATGDQDATVHFWHVPTSRDLMAQGYDSKVCHLSWDSAGRFLATAGGSDVLVWDCSGKGPAGTTPQGMDRHQAGVTALAFQHRGGWLVSGAGDGELIAWKAREGPRTASRAELEGSVTGVAWAAGDTRVAAATAAGEVALLELTRAS